MSEERAGNLWIGTGAGLIRLQNGSPRLYAEKDGLPGNVATFVKEDREGNLWVGAARGLYQFRDDKFRYAGLAGVYVTGVTEDREGLLWISTWGDGLFRMSRQVVTTYTDKHGLAANNVYPIFEDRAGQVWMGIWRRGLTTYKNGRFSRFPSPIDSPGEFVVALAD